MKKIVSVTLVFLLMLTFSVIAFAYENDVSDNANLFSAEEHSEILSRASDFSETTEISLAILTIDFAQGLTSEEYANDYHDNLIDSEGWSEDSMLFLIDMDNRNVWISTTGRAEDVCYDVDTIIDGGYDYLVDGYYGQCILGMIDAATENYMYTDSTGSDSYNGYYGGDYNGDYDYNYDYDYNGDYDYSGGSDSVDFSDILIYIVVGLGIGGIAVFAVKSRYKNFGKGDEFDTDDVFLNLTGSNDTVISRNVVTTRIPRNNNHHRPGGGSSGGGMRHSGGGRSHGGGGRGF